MSQAVSSHARQEVVISVRLSPALIGELIHTILQAVRTVPAPHTNDTVSAAAAPDPDVDPAPLRPERSADPPPLAGMPVLPKELAAHCYLSSTPCPRRHGYQETAWCLRRRSNHGCVTCNRAYRHGARAPRACPERDPGNGYLTAGMLPRPALPGHLQQRCFLNPIRCEVEAHHWRDTRYTLRFVEDEKCVQCVTNRVDLTGTPLALAGDAYV